MLILIAQKKGPGALNTTQKTPALCNEPFLYKSFFFKCIFENFHFWQFFLIFSGTVHCRELGSFALLSVQQDAPLSYQKQLSENNSDYDLGWLKVYVYH